MAGQKIPDLYQPRSSQRKSLSQIEGSIPSSDVAKSQLFRHSAAEHSGSDRNIKSACSGQDINRMSEIITMNEVCEADEDDDVQDISRSHYDHKVNNEKKMNVSTDPDIIYARKLSKLSRSGRY